MKLPICILFIHLSISVSEWEWKKQMSERCGNQDAKLFPVYLKSIEVVDKSGEIKQGKCGEVSVV